MSTVEQQFDRSLGARALVLFSWTLAAGCASSGAAPATPAIGVSTAARPVPNDIRWFRSSAEYRALTRQVYAMAAERLPELSRGLTASSWAVILDADETILDNSEYQRRRAVLDSGYTEATWATWVGERAAPAIPGAPEFTKRVHSLGGRVVIVTNRAMNLCDATRANLTSAGIEADLVLCQPQGESNKNPRFERVRNGTAAPGIPALTVIEWIGDNIQDFPGMTQAVRNDATALSEFGKRYFVLPNPMYGSWQQVREP